MIRTIQALFFDLDNTLCNGDAAFQRALDATIARLIERYPALDAAGVRIAWQTAHARELLPALERHELTMAAVRARRWPLTLRALGISDTDGALAAELDLFLGRTQLEHLRLYEDVAALTALGRQYHLGIITNGAADDHPDSQRTKAANLGLLARMQSFVASDSVGIRKPDPRIFALALAKAGIAPGAAVYVGDSVAADIVGANRAGLRSVLLWRSDAPMPLAQGDHEWPAAAIRSLYELPGIIERLA
jgi:putative hydrolase of the HAD superfamily